MLNERIFANSILAGYLRFWIDHSYGEFYLIATDGHSGTFAVISAGPDYPIDRRFETKKVSDHLMEVVFHPDYGHDVICDNVKGWLPMYAAPVRIQEACGWKKQ
jgi:hypothetical protein